MSDEMKAFEKAMKNTSSCGVEHFLMGKFAYRRKETRAAFAGWLARHNEVAELKAERKSLQNLAYQLERERDVWREASAQHMRNEDFYRDLLDQCAAPLGPEVFVSDDGTIQDAPLKLKIPELVMEMKARLKEALAHLDACVTEEGPEQHELNAAKEFLTLYYRENSDGHD